MNKTKKIIIGILRLILVIIGLALVVYFRWEKAPQIVEETPAPVTETANLELEEAVPTDDPDDLENLDYEELNTTRKDGVYTMLLVGIDDMSDQTDTILVGKLDTKNHTANFVSIPRDTLINVPWEVKKINSVYYGSVVSSKNPQDGIDALKAQVKNLIGYDVDCYAFISVKSFVDVINAIGGVDFDVPTYIEYIDQDHGYWVYLGPGYQHLDGVNAMGVVRFRETYPTADLGRIEVQHDFLKAVAKQCLSLGTIPHAKEIIDIIKEETSTDLSDANIAYLFRQILMCQSENIQFMTVPVTNQNLDVSYAVIELDDWMKMLNEYLNPFNEDLTYANVDIVYKNYFGYGCTGFPQDPIFFATLNEQAQKENTENADNILPTASPEQVPEEITPPPEQTDQQETPVEQPVQPAKPEPAVPAENETGEAA